jgi:hypothetical protein
MPLPLYYNVPSEPKHAFAAAAKERDTELDGVAFRVAPVVPAAETYVWTRVATRGTPPAPRHFHNTCIVNNSLYVFGGYDGSAWRSDVVALDLGACAPVFPAASLRFCTSPRLC